MKIRMMTFHTPKNYGAVLQALSLMKALELYSRKLEKEGYTWVNVPEDAREQLIEESVQESTLELQSSALFESSREGYAIKRIRRMMYRTIWALSYQLEKGDFLPVGYEVPFKRNIPIDGTSSMQLRGVIDRVDICEESDKVYVKIIDYKTGKKTFDISSLYYGLQMQLITYLRMAMEMQKDRRPAKEVIPSGIMYYTVTDPLVDDFNDEEKEKMEMLKALKPDGLLNSRIENIYHLDKEPGQSSTVMQAGMKKDGTLTARSHAIAQPEWELLMEYSGKMLQNAGRQILGGDISIAPYKQGDETKCKYCPYTTVCRFDENMAGCDYRRLTPLKANEVLEMIGKEKESWESNSQKNSSR